MFFRICKWNINKILMKKINHKSKQCHPNLSKMATRELENNYYNLRQRFHHLEKFLETCKKYSRSELLTIHAKTDWWPKITHNKVKGTQFTQNNWFNLANIKHKRRGFNKWWYGWGFLDFVLRCRGGSFFFSCLKPVTIILGT